MLPNKRKVTNKRTLAKYIGEIFSLTYLIFLCHKSVETVDTIRLLGPIG